MAFRTPAVQLHLKTCFLLLLGGLMEAAQDQGSMYMWIDANQARILIGNSVLRGFLMAHECY